MVRILLMVAISLVGCGIFVEEENLPPIINVELESPDGEGKEILPLTDADFKASCFSSGCHNASAPPIPEIGAGFKESEKVKARITNGTMPPGGFSGDKLKAALLYFE